MSNTWKRRRDRTIKTMVTRDEEAEINAAWPQSGAKTRQEWLLNLVLRAVLRLRKKG